MLTRHASLIYNFVGSINNTPNPYTVYNFLANPLPELMNSCPRNKKDTICSFISAYMYFMFSLFITASRQPRQIF